MTILITGASGHLGRHVIDALLDRGAAPTDLVATARDVAKIADLTERGIPTRQLDYDTPASIAAALDGVNRVLLISSSEVGSRTRQHANVISAAREAGVELLAYTSIAKADTSGLQLAREHRETEKLLADSGLPTVLLRNGWYLENYTENLAPALATGTVIGSAGDGRVSAASRRDYAEAAAAVLLEEHPAPGVHELGGDEAFTLAEFAAEVAAASGQQVEYRDLSEADHATALAEAGVPGPFAAILADSDQGLARGDLLVESGELRTLIGRPTTPVADAVRAALA